MKTPLIILFCLWGIGLMLAANKHGQPKGDYNVFSLMFALAIEISLLYWAGLFD
jgi:asparagine N-glycosylation enzyme membrane subunit Stt3